MNEDYEAKGQRVAQYFFDELEKIAASRTAFKLLQKAQTAQTAATQGAKTLGWSRYMPFTQGHKAWFGHLGTGGGIRGRAVTATTAARQKLQQEQKIIQQMLASGKGRPDALARSLQRNKAMMARLDASEGGVRQAIRRHTGTTAPPESNPLVGKGIRMAAGGAGLLTAGVGGGLGAKYLYDRSRAQQAGGYGGGY